MNEESSSGGRGPSSIKPPTIKPPTAQGDDAFGATTLGAAAPRAAMPAQSPAPPVGALPGKQNLWPWIVVGVLLFLGLLIVVLGVVVLLWLR